MAFIRQHRPLARRQFLITRCIILIIFRIILIEIRLVFDWKILRREAINTGICVIKISWKTKKNVNRCALTEFYLK